MKEEDTKVADIFDKDIENFGKDLDKMIEHLNIVIATHNKQVEEIERLNNKYNKALELLLELLIDYNLPLPCEVDDFMNVHSDYCKTHCGVVDEEQYKRCWKKFIEWKLGSDKE